MRAIFCVALFLSAVSGPVLAQPKLEGNKVERLKAMLEGRDRALDRVNRQVAQLTEMLSLERAENAVLRASISRLTSASGAKSQLDYMEATIQRRDEELNALGDKAVRLTEEVVSREAEVAQLKERLADGYAALLECLDKSKVR